MTRRFLAIDLGAESGRGVLGEFDGEQIALSEIGRFATSRGEADLCADGVQRWDYERISRDVQHLATTALRLTSGDLAGIGVDGWGVDFGLLDQSCSLLAAPVCYRDASHAAARARLLSLVPEEEL